MTSPDKLFQLVFGLVVFLAPEWDLTSRFDRQHRCLLAAEDSGSWQELRRINAHEMHVADVDFSPDDNQLASQSGYFHGVTLSLWKVASGERERAFRWENASVFLSPGWNMLARAVPHDERSIEILWFPSGEVHRTVRADSPGLVAFSPTGDTLASGGRDGTVRLWRASDGKLARTLPAGKQRITSLAFSDDGRFLAVADRAGTVGVWSLSGDISSRVLDRRARLTALAFSPNGQLLVGGGEGTVYVWAAPEWRLMHAIWVGNPVADIATSSRGVLGLCLSPDTSEGISLQLWSLAEGSLQHTLRQGRPFANCLAFRRDGALLAAGCSDGSILLFGVAETRDSRK